MGVRVIDVINEQIKKVKKEQTKHYRSDDWDRPGNLTGHMLSAKMDQLKDLKKALRKARLIPPAR